MWNWRWFAALVVAFVCTVGLSVVAAQGVDGGAGVDPFVLLQGGLSSVAAIVSLAIALTAGAKRYIGTWPVLSALPVWVFVIAITVGLTVAANVWLGTLDGELGALVRDAVLMAAAASGFREWWAHLTKPIAETTAAQAAYERKVRS